jgi:DNA-binding CsgD family transcriptional regulator
MIVSRAAELSRLDDLLTALAGGEGSALIVRGEAGIGKTTLLEALAARSGDGVTVIRTCGAETEAELTFSALADLLDPVLDELAALPEPQAAALMGALALGPPAPGDRLAVCVATLGVLRAAARRRPVLAVVDDLQWIDASSRECIEYAARRAGGRLAVVMAARDPWYPPEHVHLPELLVGPVDDAGAAELLRLRAPDLAPPVAAAIAQAAAGNPLALVELSAMLNTGQRTGAAPLDLPLAPGRRLQRAFSGRVGALDEPARRALLIAAAHAGPELPVIAAACLGAGTDVGHLDEAEASGLVRTGADRVGFTHPLIRGIVYQQAQAARGRPDEARAAALAALRIAETGRIGAGLRFVHAALGFLELGLDRTGAAISELETVERLVEGTGLEDPVIVPWEPDLVEAYARQGRAGDARRVLARLERRADLTASPVARAAAARCRGMVDDDFERAFTAALALDDQRPMPFERARTLLAFGRRQHRARRRAEARDRLLAARHGFEELRAGAWAGQAEAELHAAGSRRRREPDDALTPQELRVAAAVQRGASSRDIAADLFLSPKTVEFHLRQIYRKLGVHSRTQLIAALADGAPEPAQCDIEPHTTGPLSHRAGRRPRP